MPVAVVYVRHVSMGVGQRWMRVNVRMRLVAEIVFSMLVPVMLVVSVCMLVPEQLVRMLVLVDLGEEQDDPQPHDAAGRDFA